MKLRLAAALILCAAVAAGIVVALTVSSGGSKARPQDTVSVPLGPRRPAAKNIVFVLTDDLSLDLLRFMPHVQAMERNGLTFRDYFVSDSLCCPSRSSIFTGNLPHDTGVFTNAGADGGYQVFHDRDEESRTFAVALRRAGYLTAFMGKYLNGYLQPRTGNGLSGTTVPGTYVPPGWSEWDGIGFGYYEYNYPLNHNGTLVHYGHRPAAYLTDVLARRGVAFIAGAARRQRPFFLELATFAPHGPYVPAPRDAHDFPGLRVPRPPNFGVLPTRPPRWLAGHPKLTRPQIAQLTDVFRRRAQSVQAVDDMIGRVEAALRAHGVARSTYIVFSSDNGLHTGEYRLMPGKLTAFDTDIHVPLVVVGPGVAPGRTTPAMAENIDLGPTFAEVGGTALSADGHSLLSIWHGDAPGDWRNAVLVEHHGPPVSRLDPDFQRSPSGNPTTYEAMRTDRLLYVEYADGEREFYNLRRDPFELHDLAGALSRPQRRVLHRALAAMKRCHTGAHCWAAMHVPALPGALPAPAR